ncbi:hypothetical protein V7S43_006004 [Phytophthora oleae]|uniref:CFA20 domain-containing protein n=1 Tax=Phytophthora oleae TaxID=2107226 RepID=A0ABD3FPL7_9STRA
MAFFQGGDFVELLSAQGKAPASSWKLQGKISKTFDKGIKGNAFTLDGSSETKMQLPKTASSSLGLAQRFIILQLLVPFTRSFSVEICFSDFHKVRRRFVAASAFRDTARTTLHVQLPLNAADVLRDQWMNLVFDLQTLSEIHFPDTGYRSMESICVSGSCRLKRIFTMKDAPTPSRGSQAVRHADIREIPRQFVFSATQRGSSVAVPIPTLYFSMESGKGGLNGVAVVGNAASNATPKTSRRGQTAPVKAQGRTGRATRPATDQMLRKAPVDTESDKPIGLEQQRLRTPARVSTSNRKLRQPQKLGKVIVGKKGSPRRAAPILEMIEGFDEEEERHCQVNKSSGVKSEIAPPIDPVVNRGDHAWSPPNSVHSPKAKDLQPGVQSQTLRQSIMGEIQQKIADLEADDERADHRDRELFLKHTSLHSGEWHLQQLRDDDDDGALLSDDDVQLSSSWRRERIESTTQEASTRTKTSISSRYSADKDSMFSFTSLVEPNTGKRATKLFDFDSLLQDVEPLTQLQSTAPARKLESRIEQVFEAESDSDDQELTKLLAAKRSARRLLLETTEGCHEDLKAENERQSEDEQPKNEVKGDPGEKDGWVMIGTTVGGSKLQGEDEKDSDVDMGGEMTGLSIDLTSELSASDGGSESDLGDAGEFESSVDRTDPTSPQIDESTHDSDHASNDDDSFDFEDLVDESSDHREEDEELLQKTPTALQHAASRDLNPKLSSSPQRNQKRQPPPVPPRRTVPVKSQLINSRPSSRDKALKSQEGHSKVQSPELSSSFSSRRLQRLLESTDWSAELKSQADNWRSGSPSNRRSNTASRSSSGVQRSSVRSSLLRPQKPSTSSIELVYDPILRCYYDPVANKYYALAE